MNRRLRFRLAALLGAVGLLLALVAWSAHGTWTRAVDVREHFRLVQGESAQLAETYQRKVRDLDSLLLRARLRAEANDWAHVESGLHELDRWLDTQRPHFATTDEARLFGEIDRELDRYIAAANALVAAPGSGPAMAERMGNVERESAAMLALGFALAEAHRAAADTVLTRATVSLQRIQWLTFAALGLVAAGGTAMGWLVYHDHIAPLRRALDESHRQLERQEKLAALGVLSAGIAHEIRNPLTALKARLFTLGKAVRGDASAAEDVAMINSEIDRLERIVRAFLNFARPPEPVVQTVAPRALLERVRDLTAPAWRGQNVRIELADGGAPALRADPDQLSQALLNLVQNSAEAMPGGGLIRLAARGGEKLANGRPAVALEVADTGPGIPPDIQARIFDPFFTTKPNGTGLGLSLTVRLLEKNGGSIRCTTARDQGTLFTLLLPGAES